MLNFRNNILTNIYNKFKSQSISYVCIGSPFYSNNSEIGDIDIMVSEKDVKQASKYIIEILRDHADGLLFIKESPSTSYNISKKYYFALSADDKDILQIDVFTSYHWRGMIYFSYTDALDYLTSVNDIVVCDTKITALVGAFKDMVYGNDIKYTRFINGYNKRDFINFFIELGFRKSLLEVFINNYDKKKYFKLTFIKIWLGKYQFKEILSLVCYFLNIIKLYVLPNRRDTIVALYGPDGGGKSSVIDVVVSAPIISEIFDRIILRHTRPHIIPPISKFIPFFKAHNDRKKIVARSVVPINPIKALISILYYGGDYLLEKVYLMGILFSRRKTLYIYDRYIFEFGYQQTFSKLPKILLGFLKYISVKPLINFFLSSDSKIIASRKYELEEHDIDVQNLAFKELDKRHNLATVFIDTGILNPKAAANKVLRNLSKKLL